MARLGEPASVDAHRKKKMTSPTMHRPCTTAPPPQGPANAMSRAGAHRHVPCAPLVATQRTRIPPAGVRHR